MITLSSTTQAFATGSRARDLTLFTVMFLILLATSFRLGVYHRVVIAEVSVVYVAPDGGRRELPTPDSFIRFHEAYLPVELALPMLEDRIRRFMETSPPLEGGKRGGRFEWRIDYSANSKKLDLTRSVLFEADPQ
jgi:hypothetical protein